MWGIASISMYPVCENPLVAGIQSSLGITKIWKKCCPFPPNPTLLDHYPMYYCGCERKKIAAPLILCFEPHIPQILNKF